MVTRIELRPQDRNFSLDGLPVEPSAPPSKYGAKLDLLQQRLRRIQQAYLHNGNAAAIVFEGWDAAGKGGTIRRMASVLDPRGFKVWPIGAPRDVEAERHYLARFWQRLPPRGALSVFDRSWYGRVLVERVEKFATPQEWSRAYDEINEFERQLIDDGVRVVKLFLHISRDEQRRRFEARLRDPMKRWKLSYEDFRNRDRWHDYERAIEDMVRKTSTTGAPWNVIPANNKRHARLTSLKIITRALADGVELAPPPLDDKTLERARTEFGIKGKIT